MSLTSGIPNFFSSPLLVPYVSGNDNKYNHKQKKLQHGNWVLRFSKFYMPIIEIVPIICFLIPISVTLSILLSFIFAKSWGHTIA